MDIRLSIALNYYFIVVHSTIDGRILLSKEMSRKLLGCLKLEQFESIASRSVLLQPDNVLENCFQLCNDTIYAGVYMNKKCICFNSTHEEIKEKQSKCGEMCSVESTNISCIKDGFIQVYTRNERLLLSKTLDSSSVTAENGNQTEDNLQNSIRKRNRNNLIIGLSIPGGVAVLFIAGVLIWRTVKNTREKSAQEYRPPSVIKKMYTLSELLSDMSDTDRRGS